MQAHEHHSEQTHNDESWLSRHRWLSYVALVAIAYYLLTEHLQHVYAFLPFLFLAVCVSMHVFMHGGHSYNKNRSHHNGEKKS